MTIISREKLVERLESLEIGDLGANETHFRLC